MDQLIGAIGMFLYLVILARVILSWFPNVSYNNPIVQFVFAVTEPILSPIRRILPSTSMFDFAPMVAIIVIFIVQQVLLQLFA